ncbi:hypothetical protein [Companilactobacillus sp. DQM5]|uniref:hypothetical protein n=1 Tax=Companilactobacillus sp. DQM5 TaxID=3463359 RepID=UPI004059B257
MIEDEIKQLRVKIEQAEDEYSMNKKNYELKQEDLMHEKNQVDRELEDLSKRSEYYLKDLNDYGELIKNSYRSLEYLRDEADQNINNELRKLDDNWEEYSTRYRKSQNDMDEQYYQLRKKL